MSDQDGDPTKIAPWLDRLLDALFWLPTLGFTLLMFLSSEGMGLWERVGAVAFGLFVCLILFGGIITVVRGIIQHDT